MRSPTGSSILTRMGNIKARRLTAREFRHHAVSGHLRGHRCRLNQGERDHFFLPETVRGSREVHAGAPEGHSSMRHKPVSAASSRSPSWMSAGHQANLHTEVAGPHHQPPDQHDMLAWRNASAVDQEHRNSTFTCAPPSSTTFAP